MDARDPQLPKKPEEITNCADYVDALLRPKPGPYVVKREKIKGRRLRDRYRDEVTITRIVEPQS